MRIKNPTKLLFGAAVTSTRPPRPEMTTVIRGTFAIVPGGVARHIDGIPQVAPGPLRGDVFREGDDERAGECLYASDFADFKMNAEVLLTGSCHAPNGRPILECLTRFAVGAWSKTLRVTGDRRWDGREITPPVAFTEMPLDWAHAFGGPGYMKNPVGMGLDGQALPNVEHPKGLVLSRDDRPEPGSFAPRSPNWQDRASKLGTRYDIEYRKKRAPYYPEDFDWTHFQAAPGDQQIQGYLSGDEEIALHNLCASAPVVTTRLPGLRPRVFIKDKKGRAREVLVRLDTLLADVDAERITLTWRGLDPIGEQDLSDVAFVLVAEERLADPPDPAETYLTDLDAFAANPVMDGLPEHLKAALGEADRSAAAEGLDPVSALLAERLGTTAKEEQAVIQAALARAAERGGGADIAGALKQIVASLSSPETGSAPPPVIPPAAGGKPRMYIREQWRESLDRIEHAKKLARGSGMALPEGIAEAEAKLRDPKLREIDPTLREPTIEVPGPGADLSGQDLSGLDLHGLDLSRAKLDGAVLIGTNLRGATLTGASLRGAMLFKADLSRAILRDADLSICNAANAILAEADLRGAKLDDAYFKDADLTRARLEGAAGNYVSFEGANLTEIRAEGARFDQSELSKARLQRADLSGSSLTRCKLLEVDGEGVDLRRASLDGSSMMDANLTGARLGNARGERTIWIRARLDAADLRLSWFRGAHFTEVSAKGATFWGADLRESRFYRASLEDASLAQSNLFSADLSKAKLGNTDFSRANLYDAKLRDAAGPNCTFEGANLTRALFNEAR